MLTPERVMEIARECGFGDDDIYSDRVPTFASRIREEAVRECAALFEDRRTMILQPLRTYSAEEMARAQSYLYAQAEKHILSLIEKKP